MEKKRLPLVQTRIPIDMYDKLAAIAKENFRPISAELLVAIQQYVAVKSGKMSK